MMRRSIVVLLLVMIKGCAWDWSMALDAGADSNVDMDTDTGTDTDTDTDMDGDADTDTDTDIDTGTDTDADTDTDTDADTDTDTDADTDTDTDTDADCQAPFSFNWNTSVQGWTTSGAWEWSDPRDRQLSTKHMLCDPSNGSSNFDHVLESGTLNLVGCTSVAVMFFMSVDELDDYCDSFMHLECRAGGGWHTVWSYDEPGGDTGGVFGYYDISVCAGHPAAQIRFRATGTCTNGIEWWRLDDVVVSGS